MDMNSSTTDGRTAIIIMAAGEGKRMKDPCRAKVMFELDGVPLVHHVLKRADSLRPERVIVVVGHRRDEVIAYLSNAFPDAEIVIQEQQLGTAHAVLQAQWALADFTGEVIVLSGDVPLLKKATLVELVDHHRATGAAATILTAEVANPAGYGRIVRDEWGKVREVVEHRDATAVEERIREINSGIYVFDALKLFDALGRVSADNAQKEYYLTDVIACFRERHWIVSALQTDDAEEIHGINTPDQLERAEKILRTRGGRTAISSRASKTGVLSHKPGEERIRSHRL